MMQKSNNLSDNSTVTPISSATLLLLRDSEQGIEVFLQQRSFKASFVGGAYVFPGGKLDPEDYYFNDQRLQLPESKEAKILFNKPNAQANMVAAIRECFEEAGILLAYDRKGKLLDFSYSKTAFKFNLLRESLNKQEITFIELCESEDLTLAIDQLALSGHWITPETSPQRFDTLFFSSLAPEQQWGSHDDYESINSVWWTATEALEQYQKNAIQLIFPTVRTLEQLSTFNRAIEFIGFHKKGLGMLGR